MRGGKSRNTKITQVSEACRLMRWRGGQYKGRKYIKSGSKSKIQWKEFKKKKRGGKEGRGVFLLIEDKVLAEDRRCRNQGWEKIEACRPYSSGAAKKNGIGRTRKQSEGKKGTRKFRTPKGHRRGTALQESLLKRDVCWGEKRKQKDEPSRNIIGLGKGGGKCNANRKDLLKGKNFFEGEVR